MQTHLAYSDLRGRYDTIYRPLFESDENKTRSLWLTKFPRGVRLSITDDYNSGKTQEKSIFLTRQDMESIIVFLDEWLDVVEANENPKEVRE